MTECTCATCHAGTHWLKHPEIAPVNLLISQSAASKQSSSVGLAQNMWGHAVNKPSCVEHSLCAEECDRNVVVPGRRSAGLLVS